MPESLNQNTCDEVCFLKGLLEVLGATSIRIRIVGKDSDSDYLIVCGFDAKPSRFLSCLNSFIPLTKDSAYKQNNHHIASFKKTLLRRILVDCYNDVTRSFLSTCNKRGFYFSGLGYNELKTTLTDSDLLKLRGDKDIYGLLVAYGLGIKNNPPSQKTEKYSSAYVSDPRAEAEYLWSSPSPLNNEEAEANNYIGIEDWNVFTKIIARHKGLLDELMNEQRELSFLHAQHPRLGAESEFHGKKHEHYDKNVFREIFQLLSPKKPHFFPTLINEEPEIKSEDNLIKEIASMAAALQSEVDSLWPYPNKERKQEKINFLQLILFFKDVNPSLSLKTCLKFAKHFSNNENYKEVLLGDKSHRTTDLLKKLEAK